MSNLVSLALSSIIVLGTLYMVWSVMSGLFPKKAVPDERALVRLANSHRRRLDKLNLSGSVFINEDNEYEFVVVWPDESRHRFRGYDVNWVDSVVRCYLCGIMEVGLKGDPLEQPRV